MNDTTHTASAGATGLWARLKTKTAAGVTLAVAAALALGLVVGGTFGGDDSAARSSVADEQAHDHDADGNHVDATDDHDDGAEPHTDVVLGVASTVWDDDAVAALSAYDDENDNVSYTITDDAILIDGNGVPDHDTGAFPNSGNPNTISSQDVSMEITRTPSYVGTATAVKVFGVSVGGVVFDPGTAERDSASGWSIEAFNPSGLFAAGVDFNNAHVQPDGTYHYHGVPTSLDENDGSEHSLLVGFAADGFPIYSLYGYADSSDATSSIVELHSSWQLKSGERGAGEPDGDYTGDYTNDFEFVSGSGDLDECNGIFTVTPEFPSGTYAYFLTDEFPFVPRCVMGEVDASVAGGGPDGGAPGGGPDGGAPGGTMPGGPPPGGDSNGPPPGGPGAP